MGLACHSEPRVRETSSYEYGAGRPVSRSRFRRSDPLGVRRWEVGTCRGTLGVPAAVHGGTDRLLASG